MNFIYVGLGGMVGATLRYACYLIPSTIFPWATLLVNALGCFCAGAMAARFAPEHPIYIFCTIGVLGSFTTFSAFTGDTWLLLKSGQTLTAWLNITITLGIGLLLYASGRKLFGM